MLHPDKLHGRDKEDQLGAIALFNRVQKAHDILADVKKRSLYDTLGHEGLKISDDPETMQLITSATYADEMRERFKFFEKIAKEAELAKLSRPQGSISVNINAVELFDYLDEDKEEDFIDENSLPLPNVSVTSIDINQSATVPFADQMISLEGSLNTSKGDGSGHVGTGLKRMLFDSSWVEVQFLVGRGPIFVIKGFRSIGLRGTLNGNLILPIKFATSAKSSSIFRTLPLFDLVFGQKICDNLHASFSLKSSLQRIGSSLTYNWGKSQLRLHLNRGIRSWSIKGECTYPIEQYGARISLAAGISSREYSIQYGLSKNLTTLSSIGMDVVLGTSSGVTLNIKYNYGSQNFRFNFLLYDEILLSAIFYGTIVPVAVYSCVNSLIVKPYQEQQKRHKIQAGRAQNSAKLAEMQKEALSLQKLWQSNYQKSVQQENEKNGLVIEKAFFGSAERIRQLKDQANFTLSSPLIDLFEVTIPLQCQVKESSLHLPNGSKVSTCPLPHYITCLSFEHLLLSHLSLSLFFSTLHLLYRFTTLVSVILVSRKGNNFTFNTPTVEKSPRSPSPMMLLSQYRIQMTYDLHTYFRYLNLPNTC